MSDLEATFLLLIRDAGLPEPDREFEFYDSRKWRFDFVYRKQKVAVECEGGTWSGGRHVRGQGFENDLRKYNRAALCGWKVLRFTRCMVESGEAVETLKEALL